MHRLLSRSLLLGIVLLLPVSVQARSYSKKGTNYTWQGPTFPQEVEMNYNAFVAEASSLAGAPQGGRALEAQNPARFDPPSAFERHQKKNALQRIHFADEPSMISGSSRHIDRFNEPVRASVSSSYNNLQSSYDRSEGYGTPSIDYPTSSENPFNQERTANRSYEEKRQTIRNRRELTVQEKRIILNQKPIF